MEPTLNQLSQKIYFIRGQQVMLDSDLALLYGVETKAFNRAVKRNLDRFPDDFMFQLTNQELVILRYQIGTSSSAGWGGRRYMPFAFTEQGVAMLSGVLTGKTAVQVNIAIMRTFVEVRRILVGNKELASKLFELEKKYDAQFKAVFDAIRHLMRQPEPLKKRRIGF
jgi:phage regulator Rha-like protein